MRPRVDDSLGTVIGKIGYLYGNVNNCSLGFFSDVLSGRLTVLARGLGAEMSTKPSSSPAETSDSS